MHNIQIEGCHRRTLQDRSHSSLKNEFQLVLDQFLQKDVKVKFEIANF